MRGLKPRPQASTTDDVTSGGGKYSLSSSLSAELDLDLSITRNAGRTFQKRHKYTDLIEMQNKRRLVDERADKMAECANARSTKPIPKPENSWIGESAYDYGMDYRCLIDGISTRQRAVNGSRYRVGESEYELALLRHLGNKDKRLIRAASLSRMQVEEERIDYELSQSQKRVSRSRSAAARSMCRDEYDLDRYMPNEVLRGHATG